jgi:hypothetical protein
LLPVLCLCLVAGWRALKRNAPRRPVVSPALSADLAAPDLVQD